MEGILRCLSTGRIISGDGSQAFASLRRNKRFGGHDNADDYKLLVPSYLPAFWTLVGGCVHVLFDEPGIRPYEQWIRYYPLHDSDHNRIRQRPSFEALRPSIVCSIAAEKFDHHCFQEPCRGRFDSVRCDIIYELKHVDESLLSLNLNLLLSAFRMNATNFLHDQVLDSALSDRHHDAGISATVCAIVFRRCCAHSVIHLLIE